MRDVRILAAEAVGTFILMLGGPGVAVLAAGTGALDGAAVLAVSLGFGLALLVAAYAVGPISGCHINPAVTLGLAVMRKIEVARIPAYVVGQLLGAVVGGGVILILRNGASDDFDANPATFATNLWGSGEGYEFFGFGAMALAEIVFTAVLVFVVLSTTRASFPPAAIGVSVGLTLTLIHLASIPIDNTSVNPARSIGMAVFAGGDAVEQIWAFIVFPLLGALLGVVLWLAVDDADLEDSLLGDTPLAKVRDAASGVTDRLDSGLGAAGDAIDGD